MRGTSLSIFPLGPPFVGVYYTCLGKIYIHTFRGSVSVSQRQYYVEQVKSTQIYTIFTVSDTTNILENSIIYHLCT